MSLATSAMAAFGQYIHNQILRGVGIPEELLRTEPLNRNPNRQKAVKLPRAAYRIGPVYGPSIPGGLRRQRIRQGMQSAMYSGPIAALYGYHALIQARPDGHTYAQFTTTDRKHAHLMLGWHRFPRNHFSIRPPVRWED